MKTIHKEMKGHAVAIRSVRQPKSDTLRFRVDSMRKKYWAKAMEELKVDDFSSYARQAIDRAIHQDLRALDPKWQKFISAVQPLAKDILNLQISDNPKDRLENLSEIEKILEKKGTK